MLNSVINFSIIAPNQPRSEIFEYLFYRMMNFPLSSYVY